MDLKMIDHLIDASKKAHDEYSAESITLSNIYGDAKGVTMITEANGTNASITLKTLEEKQDDITV